MAIKVKELKDDAIISVEVNKTYYIMLKSVLFFLYEHLPPDQKEKSLKNIMEKDYPNLNDFERSFQTISRLLAEIEKQAEIKDLYKEKEILEPGDPEYVEPTQD